MREGDGVDNVTGFFLFRNLINNYNEIKNDESLRQGSNKHGRWSIILSTLAMVLALSMFLMFGVAAFGPMNWAGFGHFTSMLANIIAGIVVPVVLALYGFVFAVMQVRLNRRPSGVVGIVLSTLTLTLIVVAIIFFFI
jgi:cation transporter-like permease